MVGCWEEVGENPGEERVPPPEEVGENSGAAVDCPLFVEEKPGPDSWRAVVEENAGSSVALSVEPE